MKKQFLEIGKIVSVSGIKGEVRVQPWCDSISFFENFKTLYFDEGKEKTELKSVRQNKGAAVLKLSCSNNIDEANALRGRVLYINRADISLDENTVFIEDLLGIRVIDADNESIYYGDICDVTKTGANDVYHIKKGEKVTLVPAIADVIVKTDLDAGVLKIRPLAGLFDNDGVNDDED